MEVFEELINQGIDSLTAKDVEDAMSKLLLRRNEVQ